MTETINTTNTVEDELSHEQQPGTVQGSTTDVISNQQGVDVNHDGDDKKILENYDAEKITDEINSIKTISNAEYLALSDEEKKKYVVYNPGLSDAIFYQWLALQTQLVNGFNTLGPAIEKMDVLENITFLSAIATNLSSIAESVAAVPESVASLSSALSKVGLGKLIDIITSLAKGIGALCALVIANMLNPFANIRAYYTAYQQIDFSSIKTLLEPHEGTPSIATMLARQQAQLNTLHIPSEEIKNKIGEQSNAIMNQLTDIANAYNSIQVIESLIQTAQEVDTLLSVAGSIMSFSVSGIAKEAFNAQYDATFDKEHVDYQKKADKLTKQCNEFQKTLPIEWISKEDLAKLKELEHTQDVYEDQDGNGIVFPNLTTTQYNISTPEGPDENGNYKRTYYKKKEDGTNGDPVKTETYKIVVSGDEEKEKIIKTEYWKYNESTQQFELKTLKELSEKKVADLTTLSTNRNDMFTTYLAKIDEFYSIKVDELNVLHQIDVLEDKIDVLEDIDNPTETQSNELVTLKANLNSLRTVDYPTKHQAVTEKIFEVERYYTQITSKKRTTFKEVWTDADTKQLNVYESKYESFKDLEVNDLYPNS